MKWALLLFAVLAAACVQPAAISGTAYITTCSGEPAAGGPLSCRHDPASVGIVLLSNSTVVNRTLSSANGSFVIKAQPGTYMLCIENAVYSCQLFSVADGEEKKIDMYTLPLPS